MSYIMKVKPVMVPLRLIESVIEFDVAVFAA